MLVQNFPADFVALSRQPVFEINRLGYISRTRRLLLLSARLDEFLNQFRLCICEFLTSVVFLNCKSGARHHEVSCLQVGFFVSLRRIYYEFFLDWHILAILLG